MTDEAAFEEVWRGEAWRAEATAWLDETLGQVGVARIGNVSQPHLEPWSTVLSAETDAGRVWLKAMVPGTAFEIALYDVLVAKVPDHVLHPIGANLDRGWLLLPDGGPSLADRLRGSDLVEAMVIALPQYAVLQRALDSTAEVLTDLGLADLRADVLPERYEEALVRIDGEPYAEQLSGLQPDYLAWCELVKGSPLPSTLDHNDLHPWNILGVGGDVHECAVFYDWGDSVVAHPLGSASVPISRVRKIVGLEADSPEALRMRDAYLEAFTDVASRRELVELFEVSCRLAKATRAVVWDGSARDIGYYLDDLRDGFGGM